MGINVSQYDNEYLPLSLNDLPVLLMPPILFKYFFIIPKAYQS